MKNFNVSSKITAREKEALDAAVSGYQGLVTQSALIQKFIREGLGLEPEVKAVKSAKPKKKEVKK